MARYPVYLETDDGSLWMAHVLELPGCFVRAASRERALDQVAEAIAEYLAWLRRHGEAGPPEDEPIEIELAGEVSGYGPFERGDAAALFAPERKPISLQEMEGYFRLLKHSRASLLALVQTPSGTSGPGLSDEVMDWQLHPGALSLRQLLRHVGNAEEWYVSRLVPFETLPEEWDDDEGMPVFQFLSMSRRTAIERLRKLDDQERAGMFFPYERTRHPQEPWTARKALRRFLEHEREHTFQAREILRALRQWLFARLASQRARLLAQLVSLDKGLLSEEAVVDDWTAKDMLAHIAAWDRWEEQSMRAIMAGKEPDWKAVRDINAANAAFVAASRQQSLAEVLAEVESARNDWVAWLERLPEEEFFRPRSYYGYDWSFHGVPIRIQWQHDAGHADELATWRQSAAAFGQSGPKEVLIAALNAARQELLAAASLVPAEDRDHLPICGRWTLKDVLGHIADWEWLGTQGLRQMAVGRPPEVEQIDDFEAWNQSHAKVRRDQAWDAVWADLHAARQALLDTLETMGDGELEKVYPFPWEPKGTAYEWVGVYSAHDREHARDLLGWAGLADAA